MTSDDTFVTSGREMVALGFLGVAGNISPFILPVIVGALVDYVDFSVQHASYIASADMFGLGVGTLIWSWFITSGNWRVFAFIAAILLFLGNTVCAFSDSFLAVSSSRFIAGVGGGLMLTIGVSGLSRTINPDRVVAIYTMLVTVTASIVLYVFPYLLVQSGARGMFLAMAGFACAAAISSFFIPAANPGISTGMTEKQQAQKLQSRPASKAVVSIRIFGVLGVLVVFLSFSLFWVYIERAGVAAGFVTSQIATGLGTAQFTGVGGALTAAIISTRFGNRMYPFLFTIVLSLIAAILIPTTSGFVFYLFAASALIFSWNMLYPYVIGLMISLDATARLVTYAMVMMTLGKSLSPIIGAFLVTETNFHPAYWACVVGFVGSATLFIPALLLTDRKLRRGIV